jgi:hypothetical protein
MLRRQRSSTSGRSSSLSGSSFFAIGSVFSAGGASAANPSANLDQCANDPVPSPSTDGCNTNANQWVNGNLGQSKAVYFEGDSIAYRMRFDNLTLGSHTVIIEWDTTKSSKHAIDYLRHSTAQSRMLIPVLESPAAVRQPRSRSPPIRKSQGRVSLPLREISLSLWRHHYERIGVLIP